MRIAIPKQLASLGYLLDWCEHFFEEQNVEIDTAHAIMLAIDEIFTNFVKHQSIGKKDVEIELLVEEQNLKAILKDYDVDEYDFTKQKPADMDALAAIASPGGRGLFLAMQLLDKIEYAYANRVCTVTLTKSLRSTDV